MEYINRLYYQLIFAEENFIFIFIMLLHLFISASVHCCLVVTCWERADLVALACDVLLCFCHFPMWYPGSGEVLDYIDS